MSPVRKRQKDVVVVVPSSQFWRLVRILCELFTLVDGFTQVDSCVNCPFWGAECKLRSRYGTLSILHCCNTKAHFDVFATVIHVLSSVVGVINATE